MAGAKRGAAFLYEDVDDGRGAVLLGTFSGHHEGARTVLGRIEGLALDEALAWARERAPEVEVALGDIGSEERYSAGDAPRGDLPPWPEGRQVGRHRPAGQEWRDRAPADAPVAWAVEVELSPPFTEARRDWEAVVAELAARADAASWDRGSLPADPGRVLLPDDGPDDDFDGYDTASYVLDLVVEAPTADAALREAVRRCDRPRGWAAVAAALPLELWQARPQADTWIVEGDYGLPARHAKAIAAAMRRGLADADAVLAAVVDADGASVAVSVTVAASSAGRAQGVVEDAIDVGDVDEDIGWTLMGWRTRPA